MSITQGEAVFQAVCEVIGHVPDYKVVLTPADLKEVHKKMLVFFEQGVTQHSKGPTKAELIKYIPGLVNNWLRKDLRLNGRVPYVAKNPGSRSGSGDEAMKAMRVLLSVTSDPESRQQIQAEIDKRRMQLKVANQPAIDVDALPEPLRHLVPQ